MILPGSGYEFDLEKTSKFVILLPKDTDIPKESEIYSLNKKVLFHNQLCNYLEYKN